MKLSLSKVTKRKRYYGFILKPGFWYGRLSENNKPAVVTGLTRGDLICVFIYSGKRGIWDRNWIP